MPTRGLFGLVPVKPGATLFVVVGEDEPGGFLTAAFADEPVLVAVGGSASYCDDGRPELGVE
jgi:hypothetical protein